MRLVLVFSDLSRAISDEDGQWLIAELLAADEESSVLGRRLQHAAANGEAAATTVEEKRKLLQLFERSARPRSHELRALEIAIHADVYAAG